MKKMVNKNMKLIIIVLSILILILIVISLIFISKSNKDNNSSNIILNEVVELPGTEIISNEKLSAEHCLNDICVSDVKIYKVANNGRLECSIENKSNKVKSGYFKLVFPSASFVISYKDLKLGVIEKSIAQYTNKKVIDTSDYVLKELTKEEQKSIIK